MHFIILHNSPKYYDIVIPFLYDKWYDLYKSNGYNTLNEAIIHFKSLKNINTYIYLNSINNEFITSYALFENNNKLLLVNVFIIPKYRKKGIGKKIVNDAIKRVSKQTKYKKLELYSYVNTLPFYKSLGFNIISKNNNKYLLEYYISNRITYILLYISIIALVFIVAVYFFM